MNNPTRPIGTMLFLGPTGSGKTRVVEAASEVLLLTRIPSSRSTVRVSTLARDRKAHRFASGIPRPPRNVADAYAGNLDKAHTEDTKLTFVLFDEIEKASDSLWQLLLGILDKATLTLATTVASIFQDGRMMTSNLGLARCPI
jgi:ATP-dependent Clp protease ATP-binding subunit ClpA